VAILTRRVGVRHVELVEDAVQAALLSALTAWTAQGLPDEPGAWLYQAACNHLYQELRKKAGRERILNRRVADTPEACDAPTSVYFAGEVRDDMLRMLFVCCHDDIPMESRLVLALKSLCGFSVAEIALRLFTTEDNVYKRLARARERLREAPEELTAPALETLAPRLASVQAVLYLLFNEGYLSAHATQAIVRELCDDAIRLATLLAEHPVGNTPETCALLALMHLHAARLEARTDGAGGLLLLEEQARSLWDESQLQQGAAWLERSAHGQVFSRYHAEAGIAAEHCFSPSFTETRWQQIAELYSILERVAPSPLHTLNRAVAVAEWQGADAGLAVLVEVVPPAWLAGSYLWNAVSADLHRRVGNLETARAHRKNALASAPTEAVRQLLRRRLGSLG
jgi:RNA polymerase sigma-70 factor (ECF subfamily)